MLTQRLVARCSSAVAVSPALINGYRLEFSKRSKDGSGKATLVSATNSIVHGVLFEIAHEDLSKLDKAEGAGYGYERVNVGVQVARDIDLVDAYSYLATEIDSSLRPYNWYKALVLAGAIQHQLPEPYRIEITNVDGLSDTIPEHASRLEAIKILKKAGFEYLMTE